LSDDKTRLDELADALNNHQITDEEGEIIEEQNSNEESATQEEDTVEKEATAEKSAEPKEESTHDESEESENEPEMVETASDETGKRYVPESRFKEVYAKWKKAQRDAKSTRTELPKVSGPAETKPALHLNKTDALEVELLKSTLPQFNPDSDSYDSDIDELGYSLYESSKDATGKYSITRLEAGRRAIRMAKQLSGKIAKEQTEAKSVKAQQSDRGIANRVLTRETEKLDPEKMTLEEKEEWLKANNLW